MSVANQLRQGRFSLSFEFFPPKNPDAYGDLLQTAKSLQAHNPTFMSVTYGALGSQQDKTLSILQSFKNEVQAEIVSHFTCIGLSAAGVDSYVQSLTHMGITHMLALRGDIPQGVNRAEVLHDFEHAVDLVAYMKKYHRHMTLGVAAYPEGHPEAVSLDQDLVNLKQKCDAGADFAVTQLFFDNDVFEQFVNKAKQKGIIAPIIPGIMPVTNYKMIERITQMCKVRVPQELTQFFSSDPSVEDMQKFALDFTLKQCEDLLKRGVAGLHFYTLNKTTVVDDVCKQLRGAQKI